MSIEPTPESVSDLYTRMAASLERARVTRAPLTLAEKLLLSHLDEPAHAAALVRGQSYVELRPDRVQLQDVLGQTGMLQFMQTGRDRVAVPTTIHCDHLIQARHSAEPDLSESLDENSEVYAFLRSAAAKYGIGFWEPGAGIMHQVVLEQYAFPGALMLGTDSHTPMAGGLGAFAVGVGGADAVEAMAGLPWEVLYPRVIGIRLTGALNGWTSPKDVILHLAGVLGVAGATNAVLEYFGPGTETLLATGKATICNMGAELGATTSVFPFDGHMQAYLVATGRAAVADLAERHADLFHADADASYDQVVEIDLGLLEPHVVGPHSPDRARPISRLVEEVHAGDSNLVEVISTALIGSCTNSSYADMTRAAHVADEASAHGLRSAVPLMVTPGSEQIRATIARDGQLAKLESIGATVLANACGPCIGQWQRAQRSDEPNTIVTSYNRNFPMRNDGRASTMNFIASPEIVTALALAGRLSFNPLTDSLTGTDGESFRLQPPPPAPDVPDAGFDPGRSFYVAPPEDGSAVQFAIDPSSERLQPMRPWPAWDGNDLLGLPVLVKAQGKTTTDHIAPAGPWLRFRGNLERFADATFLGVANAFSSAPGTGVNALSGAREQRLSEIAREYREQGVRWIAIGDWNYGEGSSREHAALAPRLLGCAVIVARSFARIHESNLKKQGILALTFVDPADYERVRADDRVDLLALDALQPDHDVECALRHADATRERIWLRHSYTAAQLDWFRQGSALNAMKR
ncbi:MAG: aconitate hydratase [Chloroflexi bacterium]|nr:aconitate hydratase [Chloroflexota bacterium]MBV9897748.1 aconitate hydratase [Chloroflexota bacterium]